MVLLCRLLGFVCVAGGCCWVVDLVAVGFVASFLRR